MSSEQTLRVASVRFAAREHATAGDWLDAVEQAVRPAAATGARLVTLPEYVCLGLVGTLPRRARSAPDDELYPALFPQHRKAFVERCGALARELDVWLSAGTFWSGPNEAFLFGPDGERLVQRKLHLTPGEVVTATRAGDALRTIDVDGVPTAFATCYDVEFPEVARALVDRGVELLLVPSFTLTPQGAGRVATCAHARAVENQCFAVVTPLNGGVGIPEPDGIRGYGDPLVCGPIDDRFRETTGTLAVAAPDEPFALCELDVAALRAAREASEVPLLRDRRPELYARLDEAGTALKA